MKRTSGIAAAVAALLYAHTALAAVSAQEAARLGADLTPVGAEKAGNAAGTIPAWDGGLTAPPPGISIDPAKHLPDPFAADQPLYTVTAANMAQYESILPDGHKELLKAYPGSYFMKVYPSRRSCAYPPMVYDAIKGNAVTAQIIDDGYSVTGTKLSSPFPIPKSAQEILWNHELRYQGYKVTRESAEATPTKSGDYTITVSTDNQIYRYANPALAKVEDLNNEYFFFFKQISSPSNAAGSMTVLINMLDQRDEGRRVWRYAPGERKVKRAIGIGYDAVTPTSEGIRTSDNMMGLYNGAQDRYDWELLGKQEELIPYNTFALSSPDLKYKDILHKQHLNQDPIRYELHRTWVVEGKLKPGKAHAIVARRRLYVDEDTWSVSAAALYGADGKMARAQEGHMDNYYDQPLCELGSDVVYDIGGGRYNVLRLGNEQKPVNFNTALDEADFSPSGIRRIGVR
ncbi:MAG: DUF1329 domain-containing protein [Alphaproteobacteria bacterium]|nr:DUF1329 domain-containing protein [Alphaproteobacteria bacterium]